MLGPRNGPSVADLEPLLQPFHGMHPSLRTRLSPRSPNLNPQIERFIRSVKDESLSRMILFGEKMLRNAVGQYLAHYHAECNHQGLGNQLIDPGEEVALRLKDEAHGVGELGDS